MECEYSLNQKAEKIRSLSESKKKENLHAECIQKHGLGETEDLFLLFCSVLLQSIMYRVVQKILVFHLRLTHHLHPLKDTCFARTISGEIMKKVIRFEIFLFCTISGLNCLQLKYFKSYLHHNLKVGALFARISM